MNRALAVVLAFCAITARGEDWQKKLTPPGQGTFPPLRPLHATYRFGWSKIQAASANFDYAKTKDGSMKLEVDTKTEGFVVGF